MNYFRNLLPSGQDLLHLSHRRIRFSKILRKFASESRGHQIRCLVQIDICLDSVLSIRLWKILFPLKFCFVESDVYYVM